MHHPRATNHKNRDDLMVGIILCQARRLPTGPDDSANADVVLARRRHAGQTLILADDGSSEVA